MVGITNNTDRAEESYKVRVAAAELARSRGVEPAVNNGEEEQFPTTLLGSFTKGLYHNDNSTVADPEDFAAFVSATNSGDPDEIAQLNLGPPRDKDGVLQWRSSIARENKVCLRGWESMGAGLAYDLEGPDAQSVVMPPAPTLDSDELVAEMAELYLMALARDIPFTEYHEEDEIIPRAIEFLNSLPWFSECASCGEDAATAARRRGPVTRQNLFRGFLPGSTVGPVLSQFLVGGTGHLGDDGDEGRYRGQVRYGANTIDQRVRIAKKEKDFMTSMKYFLDVQDGAALGGLEEYEDGTRLIETARDLATYVHFDALYQAYLNATLIMLEERFPLDPNLPFVADDTVDKHQGFAMYGGPHILTLVCEVATRALKAVRFSKFNVHRRARPEAIGALIHIQKTSGGCPQVQKLVDALEPILGMVAEHNKKQNEDGGFDEEEDEAESYLLPMAFSEGSPMHPSYGSGHATVAGACVTVLKAFFDDNHPFSRVLEVKQGGDELEETENEEYENVTLTVRGELEKLADNISIGRDFGGVHYFSDQWESLLLGEKIAIGILEETKLTFREKFQFSLTKFNGDPIRI